VGRGVRVGGRTVGVGEGVDVDNAVRVGSAVGVDVGSGEAVGPHAITTMQQTMTTSQFRLLLILPAPLRHSVADTQEQKRKSGAADCTSFLRKAKQRRYADSPQCDF
jgi:hypothetical protein